MKVTVKKVEVKKGISKLSSEPYLFTNAFVIFDDNRTADYITIDADVCHPDKIKPGVKAEVYVSRTNEKRVTWFEPFGIKDETPNGVTELPGNAEIDVSTGEVKTNNKK